MEHAIGKKITLEVVEGNGCDGCFFVNGDECLAPFTQVCKYKARKDHKNIIYKLIKEE